MKKILNVLIIALAIFDFAVFALAATNFNAIDLVPGTTGLNWTVPYKASEIFIQDGAGTNWTDLNFYDTCYGQSGNWANAYRVAAGQSWHASQAWSNCDTIQIRAQTAAAITQIFYTTQDRSN